MRIRFFAAAITLALGVNGGIVQAGMLGAPLNLRAAVERIKLDQPTLAPMAYTQFCLRYADDCFPQNTSLGAGEVRLSPQTISELAEVNAKVNSAISPDRNEEGLAHEAWLIAPERGDCNDYAVTKRHELISRGWPSDALLLAEVVTKGEHHLILVVRSDRGDLVLDNLTGDIKSWTKTSYRWVRMQQPSGSMLWAKLAQRS